MIWQCNFTHEFLRVLIFVIAGAQLAIVWSHFLRVFVCFPWYMYVYAIQPQEHGYHSTHQAMWRPLHIKTCSNWLLSKLIALDRVAKLGPLWTSNAFVCSEGSWHARWRNHGHVERRKLLREHQTLACQGGANYLQVCRRSGRVISLETSIIWCDNRFSRLGHTFQTIWSIVKAFKRCQILLKYFCAYTLLIMRSVDFKVIRK